MTKNTADTAKNAETDGLDVKMPDPVEWAQHMASLSMRGQKLMQDYWQSQGAAAANKNPQDQKLNMDPMNMGHVFFDMGLSYLKDPNKMMIAQTGMLRDYVALWQYTASRMLGESATPVIQASKDDRRFKDASWNESAVFDFVKQSYLLTVDWLKKLAEGVDNVDDADQRKLAFVIRQLSDAISPTNFIATNPEVMRATLESGGENLIKGLENLIGDLERGKGKLMIKMTDANAFTLGENIGTSKGKVVYQNDMMQLIQYSPSTEKVHKTPLLIIPPWINKFYILDMREKNSYVKWCVDQGHTVFLISWVNPDSRHAKKDFADYMQDGIIEAITQIEKAVGETSVNAIGYCLGGTLLACTQAYLKAKKQESKIKSATYFVTLIDFKESGDIKVFIDDEQVTEIENKMAANGGFLDGASMHLTFNLLRPNDLIWSFVVNNYLLGKEPFPFDLLYWNGDSTRLPAAMHSFYLRRMYIANELAQPGKIILKGVPIDLRTITTPTFILSTREDHISPWESTYLATQMYSGPVKFVLSGSGHIAGVINPPSAQKYYYLTNDKIAKTADAWLKDAKQTEGSWWPEWEKWVVEFSGGQIAARDPAKGGLKPIEDAPGSYVRVRTIEDGTKK